MKEKLNCILLIDDDKPTNFLNEFVIKQVDCAERVEVALSGQEALDFLKEKTDGAYPNPALVFLDINMPAMNGFEFMEEYQKLPSEQKGQVVVVMLTTSLNPEDRAKAESITDVMGFINKPLTAEVLRQLLQKHFPEKM